jgi:hypothetical protein
MGDSISIYSRASSLQGWLGDKADLRKSEPAACIGAAQCLGSLYQAFGARITSGLLETSNIVMKLMKSSEVRVRQAALQLLKDALEGSNGGGPLAAYVEAVRIILRTGASDKSSLVRATAAACLRAVAVTGGPGVGSGGLEACIFFCLKALEDNAQAVRDGFAAALGALLALGLNPNAQVSPTAICIAFIVSSIDHVASKLDCMPISERCYFSGEGRNILDMGKNISQVVTAFEQPGDTSMLSLCGDFYLASVSQYFLLLCFRFSLRAKDHLFRQSIWRELCKSIWSVPS